MKVRIFAGFQFDSSYFSRIDLEKAIFDAIEILDKEVRKAFPDRSYELDYQVLDIDSGQTLQDHLCAMIDGAEICIFEVSDKNPNVLFEMGYAYAKQKRIVLLINSAIATSTMPSDLAGTMFAKYTTASLPMVVAKEVKEKALALIGDHRGMESVFDLYGKQRVSIVCPEIPEEYLSKYATRFAKDYLHRARFGDSDALAIVSQHIARTFPTIRIGEHLSTEVNEEVLSHDVICLGGPGWNSLTENYLDTLNIPLEYGDYSAGVEDFYIRNKATDEIWRTRHDRQSRVISDVGVFVRFPVAGSGNRVVYLLNGIQTYGVLGTCRSFIEPPWRERNIQQMYELGNRAKADRWLIVFEFHVVEGNVMPAVFDPQNFFIF